MIVVLDTNVMVSGLLSPFGPPGAIVRWEAAGLLTVAFDARVEAEYRQVLARPKFAFAPERVAALLDSLFPMGVVVAPPPLKGALPDPGDQPFLEVAAAVQATALITGNLAHYPAHLRSGVPVVTPRAFVDRHGPDLAA